MSDPDTVPLIIRRAYFNPPGFSGIGTVNTRAWRAAVMPSTGGHANARAVARIYGGLDRIIGPDTLKEATREASYGPDRVLTRPSRFGLGFQLTCPSARSGPTQAPSATSARAARSGSPTRRRGSRSRIRRTRARARAGRTRATAG